MSGFFSSWATSAAKLSLELDAPVERLRHRAERGGHLANLVGALGERRQLGARRHVAAHLIGRLRQAPDRPRNRLREEDRGHDRRDKGDRGQRPDEALLLGQDLVDLARARGEQQRALDGRPAYGHGHRDDLLADLVEQEHGGRVALQRRADFRIGRAVGVADLLVDRHLLVDHPRLEPGPEIFGAGLGVVGDLGIVTRQLTAHEHRRRIEDERSVQGVDARPLGPRLQEPPQDRRDALGADRKLERGKRVVGGPLARIRRALQLVGIDDEPPRLDARVARDGGGDHLALDAKRVAFRLDQPIVVLALVEDASDDDDEADEICRENAAHEACRDEARRRQRARQAAQRLSQRDQSCARRCRALGARSHAVPKTGRGRGSLRLERHLSSAMDPPRSGPA